MVILLENQQLPIEIENGKYQQSIEGSHHANQELGHKCPGSSAEEYELTGHFFSTAATNVSAVPAHLPPRYGYDTGKDKFCQTLGIANALKQAMKPKGGSFSLQVGNPILL